MKAKDLMTKSVICIESEMNLMQAWKVLSESKISGAPVKNATQEIVGLISQADIVREALSGQYSHLPKNAFYLGMPFMEPQIFHSTSEALSAVKVGSIMSTELISVSSETEASEIAKLMRSNHIHRVVVIDKGILLGLVSSFDILKLLE